MDKPITYEEYLRLFEERVMLENTLENLSIFDKCMDKFIRLEKYLDQLTKITRRYVQQEEDERVKFRRINIVHPPFHY
jgi:hypothetical protein